MDRYRIRSATEDDIGVMLDIYNSNRPFLLHHLGTGHVDADFLSHEMAQARNAGFLSCVIVAARTGEAIGVLDYRPDAAVYLSLIMLHARMQKNGVGTITYRQFEQAMLKSLT